jgi:hypothetical protein
MTKTPMSLIDRLTFREIVRISCAILRKNFFYSDDLLKEFVMIFTDEFSSALINFRNTAEKLVLTNLLCSYEARFNFTCYFQAKVIREILIYDFNFSEKELRAFENIVSKYAGDNANENQSRCPRTHYRKFSQ